MNLPPSQLIRQSIFALLFISLGTNVFSQENSYFQDGDKTVPISFEADVLVLGGTVSAVAAAEESAKSGAKTMLVTDCNYLGDDLTATLRLWKPEKVNLTDPLIKSVYDDPDAVPVLPNIDSLLQRKDRLKFNYTVEESFKEKHGENAAKNRLSDGVIGTIGNDSIQTDGNMTIRIDLGSEKEVGSLAFVGFHLTGSCVIETMRAMISSDNENWTPVGFGFRTPDVRPVSKKPDVHVLKLKEPKKARYWTVRLTHNGYSNSIFGAELFFFSSPDAVDDLVKTEKKVDSPPRPLHVKRVLDKVLLDNNVQFLYGAFETGRIIDSSGQTKGALISNRAGRQAIVAKRVLDLRAKPAFPSAMEVEKLKTLTVEFIVVGGGKVDVDLEKYPIFRKVSCDVSDQQYLGSKSSGEPQTIVPYPIYRYLFEVDRDFAVSAFSDDIARYEDLMTSIRLATYDPQQQFTADRLSLLVPGAGRFEFDENALKEKRLLGKKAGEETKIQEKIEIKTLRAESGSTSPNPVAADKIAGETAELLGGIRPYEKQFGQIQMPGALYKIAGQYDVVVVGGGTTGAPAAIGAARAGAKTLVVELQSELGGVGTLGSINGYYHGNKIGFTAEVNEALYPGKKQNSWVASHKSNWWASEIRKAGGDVWTSVLGAGAVVDSKADGERTQVKGVLLATPLGPQVVLAKVVIDTTGSGDIARAAGSEMEFTTKDEITVQGAGLSPRGLGNFRMNNDYMFVDDTDPIDVTHVYVYGKYKYPSAFDQGKVLGTRERRRIVGDFVITALDQLNLRTYDDSIAQSWSDFDSHGYTTSEFLELYHPKKREAYYAYYPYRASLPRKLDGILVGALATSSHRDAIPMMRMQADLQNQGYALGYIAAQAAKQFADKPVRLRDVDIRTVQKHLVEIGILPPAALTEKDNYEAMKAGLPQAVKNLPLDAKNALLVLWYPVDSLPLLQAAYRETNDSEAKAVYARALALLGDKTGEQTLLDRVKNHDGWDKGWNFKAYQQFGSPSSQLDKDIMMLGRLKCKEAVPVIVQKLNELKATDDFSHHRACYLALENIGDSLAAKALADHLKKPGMMGYDHQGIDDAIRADKSDPNVNLAEESRRNSLREIGAARVLYRLGDYEGLGKRILEAYSTDLRGHFARHAAEELKQEQ